ncbi:MAG: hypothetical protein ACR2J8_12135, partial [Thermomicrobiales bacterium]
VVGGGGLAGGGGGGGATPGAAGRAPPAAGAIRDRHGLPLPEDGRPRHDETSAVIRAAGIGVESPPGGRGITTDDEAAAVAEALGEPARPEPAGLLGLLDGIDLSRS